MATKRNLVETSVSGKTEPDPSVLLEIISTGLLILAFGGVWFLFLRGATALRRMLMLWHF